MLTALVIVLAVALVLSAGEAVRMQCRRMLSRPLVQSGPSAVSRPVALVALPDLAVSEAAA
jgi:hypothetical protein